MINNERPLTPPFDYERINTDGASHLSDDELLVAIKSISLFPGYGLVAELCKRFVK